MTENYPKNSFKPSKNLPEAPREKMEIANKRNSDKNDETPMTTNEIGMEFNEIAIAIDELAIKIKDVAMKTDEPAVQACKDL